MLAWVGGWVGGWLNELFCRCWEGRGGRGGLNEVLWVRKRWVGGWETYKEEDEGLACS